MSTRKRSGGGPLPLSYFGAPVMSSAEAGQDRLAVHGQTIRPAIGGRRGGNRRSCRHSRLQKTGRSRTRRMRGGFYPSVMGNFIAAASKYIVPISLFAGYKLLTKYTQKRRRH